MNPQIGILVPPQLPSGYCYPADPQILANDFFSLAKVISSTTSTIEQFYNFGPLQPEPEFQAYPWLKTISAGGPPERWYVFSNGLWLWPHPTPPSGDERRIWVGTVLALETYDGGESGAVDQFHGPMWEVDTVFDGRVPIGFGSIPTSSPAVSVVIGGTSDSGGGSGEYKHTLTIPELPEHHHLPPEDQPATDVDRDAGNLGIGLDSANTFPNADTQWTSDVGEDEPHNNMQPYYGVAFIKRTQRVYYRGA